MAAERLEIAVEVRDDPADGIAFVTVRGDIDLASAGELETAMRSPECAGAPAVVLDLRGVPFIDSSGLQVVLHAARAADGRLAVVIGEGSAVARLLELTGLSEHLRAATDVREALAAMSLDPPGRGKEG